MLFFKMTFYLKQPRGILNLHTLEECVEERLLCYNNLKNGNFQVVDHFQYLVEDSALDRTGHFILRLIACCSSKFEYDFIYNELKLLELRLRSYDVQDLKLVLKRLLKHTREVLSKNENDSLKDLFSVCIRVTSFMLRNVYLNHIFKTEQYKSCDIGCPLFMLQVPFYFCLSMVAKRKVNLKNGFAEIPCTLWRDLLLSLYETYLKTIIKLMRQNKQVFYSLEDPRIKEILKFVKNYNLEHGLRITQKKATSLDITNISIEAKLFPLCMMNLYAVLEKTNRLAHNERFDFSLYMKGIGLPLSESLKFWENLYSKEHSTCSRCTHSWQKNEKRYIYGIRHLYGLEGSRKDYHCRPCTVLQDRTLGAREEGGCPFKQFDDSNLRTLLKSVLPTKLDDIEVMIFERNDNPNVACRIFLETVYSVRTHKELNRNIKFENPVDYYMQLKKEISVGLG